MQKKVLLDNLTKDTLMSQDLKDQILQFLSKYPDELSPEHVTEIDTFLEVIEKDESELADIYEEMVSETDSLMNDLKQAGDTYVSDVAHSLKTGLSEMDKIETPTPQTQQS